MPLLHECWLLLFPWASAGKKSQARRAGHALCWMALFALAWWHNGAAELQERLVSPWPWLHAGWLPFVVVLAYGAGGLFAGLQRHTGTRAPAHAFDGIDEAWLEILAALRQAQLDPAYLPIFLILGRPAHGVKALWEAAGLHSAVPPTPAGPAAPFCVTASRGAIFIWCGSLTGLGQTASSLGDISARQMRLRFEVLLHHLAELREPYCPINGILALAPFAAAESEASAALVRDQCQQDAQQVRMFLGVECPATLLIGDCDNDPGFRDLLERLSETNRWQALGQRFPLMPDVDPHEVGPLLAHGVTWFCRQRLPGLVYEQMRCAESSVARNRRLAAWLAQMHARAEHFASWATALAPRDRAAPPLVTGCFFAGTGATPAAQGCVGGAFKMLLDQQDHVAWAPGPLRREALCRRWTRWAVCSAAAALLLVVAGLFVEWVR